MTEKVESQQNHAPFPTQRDVVVIGGGPAGATVAALVAEAGFGVLLLEREQFPRFHIGESLMPETYWTFEKLGFLERLRESGSPVKGSVQFISESGRESKPFYFFERRQHECSYTWQVERSWFDQAMLENAAEKGAEICLGVGARDVVFEDSKAGRRQAVGVVVAGPDGDATVRARVVVDASGQNSLMARRLGIRRADSRLKKASISAHYRNGYRDPGIDGGATIILATPGNRGWFWYIPLSEDRVSVGVVSDAAVLFAGDRSPEEVLAHEIANCPSISKRLENAEQVTQAAVLSDFSYRATQCAGDGWALIGDAFGFLDPIYSSGVFLALKSGDLASASIISALQSNDVSAERLETFGSELIRGMEAIRKLVYAFYTPGFSFANFIREHPDHRHRLTDILIGDVFKDGVTDIFEDMKEFCDLPEDMPLSGAGTSATRL